MRDWLLSHLDETAGDVEEATASCLADFADLDEKSQRQVIRVGLRACLADAAKAQKVTVKNADRPDDQLPLWASVLTNGRWTRISYLRFNRSQLREARRAEAERQQVSAERLVRMDIDIELYDRHADLPDVEAVYLAEGVEFRVEAVGS